MGEIYGDVEPNRSLNPNVPFDYMGLVRSLSRHDNAAETGELSLQVRSFIFGRDGLADVCLILNLNRG